MHHYKFKWTNWDGNCNKYSTKKQIAKLSDEKKIILTDILKFFLKYFSKIF